MNGGEPANISKINFGTDKLWIQTYSELNAASFGNLDFAFQVDFQEHSDVQFDFIRLVYLQLL